MVFQPRHGSVHTTPDEVPSATPTVTSHEPVPAASGQHAAAADAAGPAAAGVQPIRSRIQPAAVRAAHDEAPQSAEQTAAEPAAAAERQEGDEHHRSKT